MRSSRNLNKSTSSSTVFRGADTERELKLGELSGEIPTLEAEELIDTENGSVVFRGADYNREMPLVEVAPNLAEMKALPLVDTSEHGGARVFRGTDTRREIPLEVIAPNLIPDEEELKQEKYNEGEKSADTSVVFRGTDVKREALLRTLADNLNWDESQEDKYMKRVKAKALERVNGILAKAKTRAEEIIQDAKDKTVDIRNEIDNRLEEAKQKVTEAENTAHDTKNTLQEAETIKSNAYNEGYNAGLEQARLEAEKAKEDKARAVGAILLSIHGQCITIFNSWREDLTSLLHESVEKSTTFVLDTEKKAILENLLEQSTASLLDAREYILRVNPQDVDLLNEIFDEKHNGQEKRWKIQVDENLASGGIIVESPSGLIKNTQEERSGIVDGILKRMSLPLSQGDQDAYDEITNIVIDEAAKAEIVLNQENAEEEKAEAKQEEKPVLPAEPAEIAEENTIAENEAESEDVAHEQIQAPSPKVIVHDEQAEEEIPHHTIMQKVEEEAIEEPVSQQLIEHKTEEIVEEPEEEPVIRGSIIKHSVSDDVEDNNEVAEEPRQVVSHNIEEEFSSIMEELDIESESHEMVSSSLNFDASQEEALKEENKLDAMEMAPPFENKMEVLNPQNKEENKDEIADEILDAMGFSK